MLRNYLKIVIKTLLQKKFFSALNLFGISTTVMIIMVVVLVFDNHTAPRAPEVYLDRMLFVQRVKVKYENGMSLNGVSLRLINQYLRNIRSKAQMCAVTNDEFEIYSGDRIQRKSVIMTEPSFWQIYRFNFLEGRPFSQAEFDQHESVVVISKALKKHFFKGGNAIGKIISIRTQEFRVIGVVDDVSFTCHNTYADAWAPFTSGPIERYENNDDWGGSFSLDILPAKGENPDAIKAAMHENLRRLNLEMAKKKQEIFISGPETSRECYVRGYGDPTEFAGIANYMMKWVGFMLLFLLLPSINLMSLNITRIRERASEMAVRKAFGASRRRLFNQLLAENIVLTLLGGTIGLILSVVVLNVFSYQLLGIDQSQGDVATSIQINYYVFGLAVAICFVFGLFSGVLPALKMSKLNPAEVLKGGSK